MSALVDGERWQEIKQLLVQALEGDPADREALIVRVRSRDPDLAREVQSLLRWHEDPSGLKTPGSAGPRAQLAAGQRLGPYEIDVLLDSGGMGAVYRARDTRLGRNVAIKVLAGDGHSGDEIAARFEREARTIASLSHPNILSLFDFGLQGDITYTVTELLLGENLRSRLRSGPLPLSISLRIAGQIAAGLAAAHEKGIVHRDLKPENIFLCLDGTAKILDFGLAKQTWPIAVLGDRASPETRAGLILGTVGYMAPEQVRGEDVDIRADVFAFGVVVHEMLSGRRPFESDTPAETMAAVLRDEPPSLDPGRVPQSLADMVRRCLSKDRNTRFASATQMLPLFDGVAGGSPLDSKEWTRRSALGIILAITLGTSRSASRTMIRDGRAVDRTIRVGSGPCALAFGDGHVWVTNRLSNTVTKIRIADGSVAGTYAVGDWPVSIVWAAQSIWVANHKWLPGEYSTLMKIDPTSGRILETFRLPGQPMHLTADATHLWVTETWPTYLLRKIRLTDGAEVAAYTAGGVPRQACSDGESVWVSNGANESLTKIRASDGKVVGALSVPGLPNHLERTGDHLWLNNHHPDAREGFLLKITAADLTIVARHPAAGLIAHAVSDRWLFASEVSRIVQTRISDGSVAAMWAASPRPEALIFDGVNLWAADQESDSVTMIKGQSLTAAAAP